MALLPVYTYGTSVLRKKAKPVKEISDELITLIRDMFETMHYSQGIGLAANQVGSMHRVFVVDISELEGFENEKPIALINPEILATDGELVMEEGCLSIPSIRGKVTRVEKIRIKFYDANLKEVVMDAGEMLARVMLHELDHLNGILFIDHLPQDEYKKILPELKDIQRGDMEADYDVFTAPDEKKLLKKK
jgi:peptide deformylase